MNEEEKQMLAEALRLSRENNAMLRSIRRQGVWAGTLSVLKWVVIAASVVWSYYAFRPYLQQLTELYQQTQALKSSPQDTLQGLMQDVKKQLPPAR